jgi:hypothetical protein
MGAEEKVKDYQYYLDTAKKVHTKEGDLEKRVEAVVDLARQYHGNREFLHSDLKTEFHTKIDFKKLGDIQAKINKEHIKKNGKMDYNASYDLLKEALTQILPAIKYGTKDDPDRNVDAFRAYCNVISQYTNQDQFKAVMAAIQSGDGISAVNQILQTMMQFKVTNAERRFFDYLMPEDHMELREKVGKYITKETNKHIKGRGTVNAGLVGRHIDNAFQQYASGQYDDMIKQYGMSDKTPKEVKKK